MEEENYTSEGNIANQNNSGFKNFLSVKSVFIVSTILIIANLVYIDILTFRNPKPTVIEKVTNITKPSDPSELRTANPIDQLCPTSCISQIYEATSSFKLTNADTTPVTTPVPIQTNQVSSVKEFFIPFGSGSSSADDWQDVFGLQASIDSTNYQQIKSVTFEASIRIPTGNEIAYVRLFNVTDKHPVWSSEVSLEGGTPKLLVSKPIALDTGNKVYQVQMKTSLKFQAILDQARLRIITY